jgi:hypothetical protein
VEEGSGIVPVSFAKSRQVGGEIYAVLMALEWFEANGVATASVHYDFENLALWVSGAYRANTEISRALVDAVRGSSVKLRWTKVRAHTGVAWNERVDQLAKSAALGESPAAPSKAESPPAAAVAPAPADSPLIAELRRLVDPFLAEAAASGIKTRYVGILNNMYARFEVLSGDRRVALFDLYNTRKKRLNPVLSPASSKEGAKLLDLWEQFIRAWR